MYDIITVGSATIDVFVKTEAGVMHITHPHKPAEHLRVYPAGAKLLIEEKRVTTGGGGTNTAVAFSKLGFSTAYLGCLGKDENGKKILAELASAHVSFIGAFSSKETGYSVVLDSEDEDRTILTHKGANNHLRFKSIDKKNLKAKWMYFSSMMGTSFKTMCSLAKYTHKKKVRIAFNPSSYLCKKGLTYVKPLLQKTNILILNLGEAQCLIGHFEIDENKNINYLLKALHHLGPEIVVITNGKSGAHVYNGVQKYSIGVARKKVKETTGAGDAFAAGFVAGYMLKEKVSVAMKMGLCNAESVVQQYGAKNGLLNKKEALRKVRRKKVEKQKI